jgi:hypothetical protein
LGLYDLKVASVSLDEPENDMPKGIPLCKCDLLLVLGTLQKAVLWPVEDPNSIYNAASW